jgi:hypothetical protein
MNDELNTAGFQFIVHRSTHVRFEFYHGGLAGG